MSAIIPPVGVLFQVRKFSAVSWGSPSGNRLGAADIRGNEGGEPGVSEKWKDELTEQLAKAILSLETVEEVYDFLEDVATIGEIRALAQRLEVARRLNEGETYPVIAQQTGASTATISRVKKCLDYGADGYKLVLEKMQ
jgi:TrpR-related protein YerC/YecD